MALAPKSKQDATLTSASDSEKSKSKIYYSKVRTEILDDNSFFFLKRRGEMTILPRMLQKDDFILRRLLNEQLSYLQLRKQ
jgi:hypothetical protein